MEMLIDLSAGLVTIEGAQVATFDAYPMDAGEDDPAGYVY